MESDSEDSFNEETTQDKNREDEGESVEDDLAKRYKQIGMGFAHFADRDDWIQFIPAGKGLRSFPISQQARHHLLLDIRFITRSMVDAPFFGALLSSILREIPGFEEIDMLKAYELLSEGDWDDVLPLLDTDGLWRPISLEAVALNDAATGQKEAPTLSLSFEELVTTIGSYEKSLASTVGRYRTMLRGYANQTGREKKYANPDSQDVYELLGVHSGCSAEEFKAAYKRTVSQWHPDRLQQMAPELRQFATERLARINEAYSKLSKSQATGV